MNNDQLLDHFEDERVASKAAVLQAVARSAAEMIDKAGTIKADNRIDKWFAAHDIDLFDDIDLLDWSFGIEKHTGILLTGDDWDYLTGFNLCKSRSDWEARYAESFTFERLSDLIVSRLKLPQVETVTILGVSSRSAGAFRAIEALLQEKMPSALPIAPSMKIKERFRRVSELNCVWQNMRVMSNGRIPYLRYTGVLNRLTYLVDEGGWLCVLLAALVAFPLVFSVMAPPIGFWLSVLMACFFTLGFSAVPAVVLLLIRFLFCMVMPHRRVGDYHLPHDIETFGDLARLISGERGGWCRKCDYDLTGSNGMSCPECGTDVWAMEKLRDDVLKKPREAASGGT